MVNTSENGQLLETKYLWIIDDDIPIYLLGYDNDEMKTGVRPIDRGTLMGLLQSEEWDEGSVKALVSELLDKAENITAFTQPAAALDYLSRGGAIPDGIVYDLVYQMKMPKTSLEYLEGILNRCVSVVQVYTEESVDKAMSELANLLSAYPTRLEKPISKSDTSAGKLALALEEKLKVSLSAQFASRIRKLTAEAVENILVRIDDLPLNIAVKLLVGEPETLDEAGFVEFLSIKVGETIETDQDLFAAVNKYAVEYKHIPSEKVANFVNEIVRLIAANVRERIQYEGWLYDVFRSTCSQVGQDQIRDDDKITNIVRDFYSFRLYDRPGDKLVRTGDIVQLGTNVGDLTTQFPILFLVLTPPCDLARFFKKTRGILTLGKMYPMVSDIGIQRAKRHGNKDYIGNSITARHPIILPSVPISKDTLLDYCTFVYEIENMDCVSKKEVDEDSFSKPLTYDLLKELGMNLERKCRVSEPFQSGILAKIKNELFSAGVPDLPPQEIDRLKKLK
jgi:hypothetical protein